MTPSQVSHGYPCHWSLAIWLANLALGWLPSGNGVNMHELTYRSMREQVTDLIRQEILAGKFEKGEAVREIPLAKRYNVSRGPIRDAILQLTNEGLLEAEPNRGARVGQVWDDELRAVMTGIRFELESFALWRLMEKPEKLDIPTFRKNLRHFELACRDNILADVVQLDLEFHRLIMRMSGLPGIEAVWLPIMGRMQMPYSRHKKLLDSYKEHKAIVDAIESGSEKLALAALKKNIR